MTIEIYTGAANLGITVDMDTTTTGLDAMTTLQTFFCIVWLVHWLGAVCSMLCVVVMEYEDMTTLQTFFCIACLGLFIALPVVMSLVMGVN